MDHEVEMFACQLRERRGPEQGVPKLVLEQEIDDEIGELVGVSGAGTLRDQARQPGAVVERLGLIENRTRETERLSDLGDVSPVNSNAAEHLVLDLHKVAWVEELAAQERGVDYLVGMGIQDAMLTQRFGLGIQGLRHSELRVASVCVKLITPYMHDLSRRDCR
jgi:hypothetical protein